MEASVANAAELPLRCSTDGPVAIFELARPKIFNALSTTLWRQMHLALKRLEADGEVRAVLICSEGKNFCTGADLQEVKSCVGSAADVQNFLRQGHEALQALEASPLPVVTAVQGLALAGGVELLLASDVVFAAKTARFGDQHGEFGLVPGWGGSQRLPRIVGLRRAIDLFVGVRWIEAVDALQWGLVNYVVEEAELRDSALSYCRKLACRSRSGLATMKQLARQGLDMSLDRGLALEIEKASEALVGADVAEGLAAFQERRKPVFV